MLARATLRQPQISPAGWGHPALRGNKNTLRGRGGLLQPYRQCNTKGFPLWGKLSPQVTDEGATAGHFPLIRRVPRHLPPKGKAFPRLLCRPLQPSRQCGTKGFPFWGKLSPQVTDEGATPGHFPLIRRAGAPPSPPQKRGRLFHGAASPARYNHTGNAT